MSDLTNQAEETMWAETEARKSWEHLAAAILAAKAAGVAEGIERGRAIGFIDGLDEAVRIADSDDVPNADDAPKLDCDPVMAAIAGVKATIQSITHRLRLRALEARGFAPNDLLRALPAEQRPAKKDGG